MDVSAFYAVVSAINFTLLGLWWVAVKERPNVVADHSRAARRMAYLVSLQFTIPGTISLLAQVAPEAPAVWRSAFTVAALFGTVAAVALGESLLRVRGTGPTVQVLRWALPPVYLAIAVTAAIPGLPGALGLNLSSIQIEGVLLAVLVFLGAHVAWVAAPSESTGLAEEGQERQPVQ